MIGVLDESMPGPLRVHCSGSARSWAASTLAPIALIKASADGMMARGFGRIVNLTASAVKSPVDGQGLSIGARSGLPGLVPRLAEHLAHRFGQPEELGHSCAYLAACTRATSTGRTC